MYELGAAMAGDAAGEIGAIGGLLTFVIGAELIPEA